MGRPVSSMVFGRVLEVVSAMGFGNAGRGVLSWSCIDSLSKRRKTRWCTIGPALISASTSAEALAFACHKSSEGLLEVYRRCVYPLFLSTPLILRERSHQDINSCPRPVYASVSYRGPVVLHDTQIRQGRFGRSKESSSDRYGRGNACYK